MEYVASLVSPDPVQRPSRCSAEPGHEALTRLALLYLGERSEDNDSKQILAHLGPINTAPGIRI